MSEDVIDIDNPPEEDLYGLTKYQYAAMVAQLKKYAALYTAARKLFGNDVKSEELVAIWETIEW
jgi:hypothetical protein